MKGHPLPVTVSRLTIFPPTQRIAAVIETMSAATPADQFPHLNHAPIVEAVIDFRAPFRAKWVPEDLKRELAKALPEYPIIEAALQPEFSLPVAGNPAGVKIANLGCKGLRFRTKEQKYVVQFNRDGFAFSHLPPYERWDSFVAEALRLWEIFSMVGQHDKVQRVGVRYINRLPLPLSSDRAPLQLGDYLHNPPRSLPNLEWPCAVFFHKTTFNVPEAHFSVNLISTVEKPQPEANILPVIGDVDVFTRNVIFQPREATAQLPEMRKLKNQAFFGAIQAKTVELLK